MFARLLSICFLSSSALSHPPTSSSASVLF
jgi:hypothetical protein